MQFFRTTVEKKDLGTYALSTTLTVTTKYNQKELNYLSGNGAPNIVIKLLISLTGNSRKSTSNANYKHYSQITHWSENRRKLGFLPPLFHPKNVVRNRAAYAQSLTE